MAVAAKAISMDKSAALIKELIWNTWAYHLNVNPWPGNTKAFCSPKDAAMMITSGPIKNT